MKLVPSQRFAAGVLCALFVSASAATAQDSTPAMAASAPEPAAPKPAVSLPAQALDPTPAEATAAVAAPAAPAAPVVVEGAVGAPMPGKGQIVFFRASAYVGMAISYKVREGEAELGTLSNGRYFVTSVEPGVHTYVVHSEAKDELRMDVEAGETYYVLGTLTMGVVLGRPNISPSDKAAFDLAAKKMKPAKIQVVSVAEPLVTASPASVSVTPKTGL
jgi:hypothetical protein